jgi:hypothetical protein
MNAVKDALRACVFLPDDLVAATERYKVDLTKKYQPRTSEEEHWVADMARSLAQLDRAKELAIADLYHCLYTARNDWDDDRKTAAENLGKRLATQPSLVSDALEQSLQGAEWKIERWEGIRTIIREKGAADEDLHRLACDLVGLPIELRSGSYKVPLVSDAMGLAALADREIERLRHRQKAVLARRDENRRLMASEAMPVVEDPNTTRLRRNEAAIRRVYREAEARLEKRGQEPAAAPASGPAERPGTGSGSDPHEPKLSDAAIKYQNERTIEAMSRELEQWRAARAQRAAHAAAAPQAQPEAATPAHMPTPTPTASAAPTPTITPTPTPAQAATHSESVPNASAAATPTANPTANPAAAPQTPAPPPRPAPAKPRPLNRFEQAEAKRQAKKAARAAAKQARWARR